MFITFELDLMKKYLKRKGWINAESYEIILEKDFSLVKLLGERIIIGTNDGDVGGWLYVLIIGFDESVC